MKTLDLTPKKLKINFGDMSSDLRFPTLDEVLDFEELIEKKELEKGKEINGEEWTGKVSLSSRELIDLQKKNLIALGLDGSIAKELTADNLADLYEALFSTKKNLAAGNTQK
ncbi:hypothetical protein [Kangiella sp.]|uniref:hypothetical protein n=1 Tax=Kangiella sp. TaxID=1920245 RepID=UPI003A94D8A6